MLKSIKSQSSIFILLTIGIMLLSTYAFSEVKIPSLELNLKETDGADSVVPAMKIISILTILSIAPAILLMMTSFTRILIVLSFVRQALGTQTMPPNQVILGLSLFLTMFSMSPVWNAVEKNAITPYMEKKIDQDTAFDQLIGPVRKFMLHETRKDDLGLFFEVSKTPKPQAESDVPMTILMPAFMISELKTAFQIGFLIYVPFLVIDMVISSILMAMGMMMLPPTVVSLPFKLVLFVLVDGWSLIVSSIMKSFQIFG
ncbi:MAG: flagellar type III secretion system pore protein FliP [Oligoflexales bacterium]